MPRGFTDKELETIKKGLMNAGKEMFERQGVRKTTVDDLARTAGIAKGSFYKFFPSKEVLFFSLMEELEEEIQNRHIIPLFESAGSEKELYTSLFKLVFSLTERYPLLNIMLNPAEYQVILRNLPEEVVQNHLANDEEEMFGFFKILESRGWSPSVSPQVLNSLFKSMLFLNLHKDEIGRDQFPDVTVLLGRLLSEGLSGGDR